MELDIDVKQARDFLKALTGKSSHSVTFQTFGEGNAKEDSKLAGCRVGPLPGDNLHILMEQNGKGAGVFVMVNEGDGAGRKAKNVVKIRALFLDCDGAPWEPAAEALKPHIRVESSPGRWHLYWLVSDCPLDQFKPSQKAIAERFGGDGSVCDLSRVMRLPGFYHHKGEPVLTRLVEVNKLAPYTVEQVVQGLGLEIISPVPTKKALPSPVLTEVQEGNGFEIADSTTGEIINLEKWATLNRGFDIVGTLRDHAPHVIRGESSDGKQHIQCPFEAEHTDQSQDLATFVSNKKKGKTESFTIRCMHAHCAGRDRLEFLSAMIGKGWVPPDIFHEAAKRPPSIYFPSRDIAQDAKWMTLSPEERRIALDLMRIAYTTEDGTLPNDDWTLARNLGIAEDEWLKYKATLIRIGWLETGEGRCWNRLIKREYDNAHNAYNGRIKGGKNRQSQHSSSIALA